MCVVCWLVHTVEVESFYIYVELVQQVKYMNEPQHVPAKWRHNEKVYV